MNRLFLILFCFELASCRSNQTVVRGEPIDTPIGKVYPAIETLEESNKRLEYLRIADEKRKADFAARNAKYRVDQPPLFEVKTIPLPTDDNIGLDASKLHPISLTQDLSIRFRLGKRIHVGSSLYTFRTESRHILTVSGVEKARAESIITKDDDGNGYGRSRIIFTPSTREVLVEDAIGGAGAQFRHIVFIPSQNRWRTVYVDLPSRTVNDDETPYHGKLLGMLDGKVYLEMDGLDYAFPIEEIETTRLEFTVG
jgi:hypothetical protein